MAKKGDEWLSREIGGKILWEMGGKVGSGLLATVDLWVRIQWPSPKSLTGG